MMTRKIPLTQGKVTIVDADLFSKLIALGPWRAARRKGTTWYAASHSHGYLHRVVFRLTTGWCPRHIDHKDGNGLNNRRSNLRSATHQQNLRNRGPNRNNKLGYKGVFSLPSGKIRAVIHIGGGKRKHLGCFNTPKEAARAYNKAARYLFGEFAWLNPV